MELKDVTSWLGIEAADQEKFKEEFSKKYHTIEGIVKDPELLKKVTGNTLGNIHTAINRIGKAHGVEFTKSEINDKPVEEIVDLFLKKKDEFYQSKLSEVEKLASSGTDEKIKEYASKYEKLEGKLKDTDSLLKKTAEEYEGYKKQAADQIKGVKLNYAKSQVWTGASFAPGTDPLKIKGFKADFSEKYQIDLDENDQVFIADLQGKRIQNPAKHSEWLSPGEVLNMEIEKAGIGIKNPKAGQPAFGGQQPATMTPGQFMPQTQPPATQGQQPGGRKLSPRATNF